MENNIDKNGFIINFHDGYGFVIGWERWGSLGGWNEIYASEQNHENYYTI